MPRYYADTHALVEILKGNLAYELYAQEELITSKFNMLELAYALARDYGKARDVEILRVVRASITIVGSRDEGYARVARLRIELRKRGRNLSLIDALGFVLAKARGLGPRSLGTSSSRRV